MNLFKILLVLVGFSSYAQNITLSGNVTDSLNNPLHNANILAIPAEENQDTRFTISDKNGNYELKLSQNQKYELTVSYLGFKAELFVLKTTTKNTNKNFILKENPDQLDIVTLNYTPPVIVKKDTITYSVDKFITGEERKLREVLKRLPGVEVDRQGNVSVNGKRVNRVLVEGKIFFTGNSKLAVNNIPADAVDKVVVLDNYNEVAMLKNLQDSEDMVLNIKLKEDKKKFAFGDVELGGGYKERYSIHPNLFYYSPKTNINFIGDLNNNGIKSFSFRDYLEFEGGFGKLISSTSSTLNIFNSDFAQFLNNQNFKANTNQFGAVNIRRSINKSTDISGYIITSNSKTEIESSSLNIYQDIIDPFTEERTVTNTLNSFFTIGKLTVDYAPSYKEDFAYNSFVKVTNSDTNGVTSTINPNQNNTINIRTDTNTLNLKQNVSYSRKLSKAHTGTLEATYNFQNDEPITEWLTNQQILQGIVPLQDDTMLDILQTKKSASHNFNAILKDYWVFNNFNHLYTSVGLNTSFNNFFNEDVQLLSDGSINNFNQGGFGNDFKYNFIDTFLGLEYKFQIGKSTFKPALYYHSYMWRTQQFQLSQTNYKNLLLPQFTSKIEFNNSEKLNFKYLLNARFSAINQLASNFILTSFNSVFRGNENLENQLYHSAFLNYYKFSLFRGLNINLSVNYNKRTKTIKNTTELNGIESFSTSILFDQPEENLIFTGRISKKINKIRYRFRSNFNYNDFYQLLNNDRTLNISKSMSSTIGFETLFRNFPNLALNYTKDFSVYKAKSITNEFENDRFEFNLEYDFFNDFILKVDYTFDKYQNKNEDTVNTFDTANASLFYQKEDSPWGFEINATNIFDIRFRQQNSFNAFLISDSRTFILPRIIMFKLSYKL